MCLLFLAACGKTKTEDLRVVRRHNYAQQAQNLFAQGKYQQAANLYQRLAKKPSAQQNIYRLQAAEVLLKIDKSTRAKAYLDLISPVKLNVEQGNQLNLLYAQLYLNLSNTDQAIDRWQLISAASLNERQKPRYYQTGALAYALSGDALKSVWQRIALDSYLDLEQSKENNVAIIEELELLPVEELENELIGHHGEIYLGWIQMAIIIVQHPKGTPEFRVALDAWGQQNSQHPGQALIRSGYFMPASIALGDISNIAVLLPESGPYKNYANAIKAGFLAAYRRHEQDALQPDIQFYDTRRLAIVPLYQQVVSQGAQLVIGPLNKKRVVELAESTDLTAPVLALNYIEGLVKENLYQFALSPIDEVNQVVKQAWLEGHRNAIVLAPESVEGERLSHYFQNAWEALSGHVLAVQTFKRGEKDFSLPVRQLLNINESQSRFKKLKKVIGYVEYNPRRRRDVDVIFIVASSSVARLINPQFYHNRARSVAVYGLSRIYSGRDRPKQDIDLENVSFCSIPWLFEQAYQGDFDKQALHDVWGSYSDKLLSLVAFGIDAYNVLPYLNDLALTPHYGATGELILNEYNRIERHLVCAKFNNGKTILYEALPEVSEKQGNDTRPIPEW